MPSPAPLNLTILHGYAESSGKVWIPWLRQQAESRGWQVWAPNLPNPLKPELKVWLQAVRAEARRNWNSRTVVVGHSLGGVLALRALSASGLRVKAVVTVSTPFTATVSVRQLIGFFDLKIDWAALKRQAQTFTAVHSKDDPLVSYDHALRYGEALGARPILVDRAGHFIGRQAKAVLEELDRIAKL